MFVKTWSQKYSFSLRMVAIKVIICTKVVPERVNLKVPLVSLLLPPACKTKLTSVFHLDHIDDNVIHVFFSCFCCS